MLTHLRIRNLAIVEELSIDPGPGLNVLTGETGAGKSLLIDSLGFIGGDRGSTELIRGGADRMSAEAAFEVPVSLQNELEMIGVESEPVDGETVTLIVKRELSMSGRGRALMNGSLVNVRDLTSIAGRLLQIHGQNAAHDRIAGKNALELVDEFGGNGPILRDVRHRFHVWKAASEAFDHLAEAERDRASRLDHLSYQIDEISRAKLEAGEEDALRAERLLLVHSEEIIEATAKAFAALDDDEVSALSQIARAAHFLQPLVSRIPEVSEAFRDTEEIRLRTQEVSRTLAAIAQETRHDPARLEVVEARLDAIERLKKKYGQTTQAILEHLARLSDEREQLTQFETSLERLRGAAAATLQDYRSAAIQLSEARRNASRNFEITIQKELQDLAMERTKIELRVMRRENPDSPLMLDEQRVGFTADGIDLVEFLIAPNPGEPLRPLHRTASGGELSRIQLAIAATLFGQTRESESTTMVFDEIDAGIGGRVADVIGRKLRELATTSQVLCVTHLPQIACFGTTHFVVRKEETDGRTRGAISPLESDAARVSELARMLGGETVSDTAISHARDLLDRARESSLPRVPRRRAG